MLNGGTEEFGEGQREGAGELKDWRSSLARAPAVAQWENTASLEVGGWRTRSWEVEPQAEKLRFQDKIQFWGVSGRNWAAGKVATT